MAQTTTTPGAPATTRLTGYDAIEYAERTGAELHKYTDPTEEERHGITLDEAREIADEDPSLIWTEVEGHDAPTTLDELLALLRADTIWAGAPMRHGDLDTTSLPTFGGAEPVSTEGVWSWDADRLIVGTCPDDYCISVRD